MFKLLLLVIFELGLSWSATIAQNQTVMISKPRDNSKSLPITSNLPRSDKSSKRLIFNFNDISLETEKLVNQYPPKLNMALGSPNYMPAQTVLNALLEVSNNQTNPGSFENQQYTRLTGHPRLLRIVAKFYSYLMKRNLNPNKDVLITTGSKTSSDLAARAYINPGDQVIVFEPFFSEYRGQIDLAGGKMVVVPLRIKEGRNGQDSNDWTFSKKELESKICNKTKLIWFNNPNNPLGKVYSLEELSFIGYLAKKYDLIIISDEATPFYIALNEPGHYFLGSLPGLYERTITLISGGKLFTNFGWRIGWVIAPEPLLWSMSVIFNYELLCAPTPLQVAYAIGLETELQRLGTPESYFIQLRQNVTNARDKLVSVLRGVGAEVINPAAAFCLVANFTSLLEHINLSNQTDDRPGIKFWKYMLIEKGILTEPMSIFYSKGCMRKTEYSLRFSILKTPQTINKLQFLLTRMFSKIRRNLNPVHSPGNKDIAEEVSTQVSINLTTNTTFT